MVHIVGAGPGAEDLITVRGLRLLKQADIVIYAGSLVNPGLLKETKQGAVIYDSAKMTLEQVMEVIGTGMERAKRGSPPAYRRSLSLRCHQRADGCNGQAGDHL